MPSLRPRIIALSTFLASGFLFPSGASAQCSAEAAGPTRIAVTIANPFQAVVTTSVVPNSSSQKPLPSNTTVARDSRGRVRVDRVLEKMHFETGPDAGKDVENHNTTICDPAGPQFIIQEPAKRFASIRQMSSPRSSSSTSAQVVFCGSPANIAKSPDMDVEDLGHRTIEGFDTHGWRVTAHVRLSGASPPMSLDRITETWCSEDLKAVLLQVTGASESNLKLETALTQIERLEPDPALFEIPTGFSIARLLPPQSPPR